jgi:hypothetical protein
LGSDATAGGCGARKKVPEGSDRTGLMRLLRSATKVSSNQRRSYGESLHHPLPDAACCSELSWQAAAAAAAAAGANRCSRAEHSPPASCPTRDTRHTTRHKHDQSEAGQARGRAWPARAATEAAGTNQKLPAQAGSPCSSRCQVAHRSCFMLSGKWRGGGGTGQRPAPTDPRSRHGACFM